MEDNLPLDEILIHGLEVWCRVGVPDDEIANPQRLLVNVSVSPRVEFGSLGDDIEVTIDYDALCSDLGAIAAGQPRRLIETLAVDLADRILACYPVLRATVEVRKFILERTEYVAARCTRFADSRKSR